MTSKVYTVYDCKAEAYLPPMFLQTKGLAIRSFVAAVNDSRHDFNKYAGDFTLFEIGEWDDITGSLQMYEVKHNIGNGLEFLKTSQNPGVPENPLRSIKEDTPEVNPAVQQ